MDQGTMSKLFFGIKSLNINKAKAPSYPPPPGVSLLSSYLTSFWLPCLMVMSM